LRKEYLFILESFGFNNTYAVAIKKALADSRGISTISDLAEEKDLTMSFGLEFLNREDGWPGLAATYGMTNNPRGIDHGLAYQAIDDGKIDITDAYSTDGDLERYELTIIALSLGCLFGSPLGILIFRRPKIARITVYTVGLLQTIPSIALLALMMPLALPHILSGIKTAAIISIGTATLAAFIGAGGLGEPIVTGLALNDTNLILQGVIPAAGLAILAELFFEMLERLLVKEHMLRDLQ